MALGFSTGASMGGTIGRATLADLTSSRRAYQSFWVDRLRLATEFLSPDNTLVCVADNAFYELTNNLRPLALTSSLNWGENLAATLVPEIGSRRKRAMIGSSQGGGIQIAKMTLLGESPLREFTSAAKILNDGVATPDTIWVEDEWVALVGLNHDALRTPSGIVIIEGTHDGRNYSAFMFEQSVAVGQNRGYQAGQAIIVDNLNFIYEQVRPLWSIPVEEVYGYGATI